MSSTTYFVTATFHYYKGSKKTFRQRNGYETYEDALDAEKAAKMSGGFNIKMSKNTRRRMKEGPQRRPRHSSQKKRPLTLKSVLKKLTILD